MSALEHIIAAIAPHRCLSCGAEPSPLCHSCATKLPYAPDCCYKCARKAKNGLCLSCKSRSSLKSITVRTMYTGQAEQALHALKFARVNSLAVVLADVMTAKCPSGLIVPLPTASTRVRQRGYDQAVLLARELARITGNPYSELLRRAGSQRQLGQTRAVRERQLEGTFRLARHAHAPGTKVVLIDDVLTTGSTLEAAANTLKNAGFTTIHAYTFAWANDRLANR